MTKDERTADVVNLKIIIVLNTMAVTSYNYMGYLNVKMSVWSVFCTAELYYTRDAMMGSEARSGLRVWSVYCVTLCPAILSPLGSHKTTK